MCITVPVESAAAVVEYGSLWLPGNTRSSKSSIATIIEAGQLPLDSAPVHHHLRCVVRCVRKQTVKMEQKKKKKKRQRKRERKRGREMERASARERG